MANNGPVSGDREAPSREEGLEAKPKSVGGVTLIMAGVFLIVVILAVLMMGGFFKTLPSGGSTANSNQQRTSP